MERIIFTIAIAFTLFSCKQESFVKNCEAQQKKVETLCAGSVTFSQNPPVTPDVLTVQSCGSKIYIRQTGEATNYFVDVSSVQGNKIFGSLYSMGSAQQAPTLISQVILTCN